MKASLCYQSKRKHIIVESLQTKQHSSRSTENHKLGISPSQLRYLTS